MIVNNVPLMVLQTIICPFNLVQSPLGKLSNMHAFVSKLFTNSVLSKTKPFVPYQPFMYYCATTHITRDFPGVSQGILSLSE